MKLISILPDLKGQIGHILDYHLALKKAVEEGQMVHTAWVPCNCTLQLPESWMKILFIPRQAGLIHQLATFFRRTLIYFSALKKTKNRDQTILFLEHFRITDIAELFCALLTMKHPPQIWLLHRYSLSQMRNQGKLHAALYRCLAWKVGKERLKFFTDSELLTEEQTTLFQKKVSLLPIPHANTRQENPLEKKTELIYCWWPGGATREAKGLKHIVRLSQLLKEQRSSIRLIVAKNALLKQVVPSPSLLCIDDELDRATYDRWMNTTDLVLLPYHPDVYSRATSGIFVEAICAGKIPLIHQGTWMAYEAKKHGLEKLTVEWESPHLLEQIEKIFSDSHIRKKIENMKIQYLEFHSISQFSKILKENARR